MSASFAHQSTASTSDRVEIGVAVPQPLVLTFPWLAITNAAPGPVESLPPLEDQFAAFAEEAAEWADASLPLAAELLDDE
ncbi:hypothetical protein [Actinomadura opuntiae]|uniref:hypothetical protein n=1 Tax=Actinomadura sp. OS1-43 TaxID=604315 RepID=UPI00255B215A|nr:hypothetical protein [Actinomadura sp. OS1-43]MDL4820916.1 hypothetical protein [Actinomadura sp. OS1-43]